MLWLIVAFAIAIIEQVPVLGVSLVGRDEAMLAYFGAHASSSFILYRDFWDVPFPGLYYLSAICFDLWPAQGMTLLRLVHLLARLGGLVALHALMRRSLRHPFASCIVVYAAVAGSFSVEGHAVAAEPFMVLCVTAAIISLRARKILLFGVLVGAAGLFKQSALAFLAIPFLTTPEDRRRAGRATAGAGLVLAAAGLPFLISGALAEAFSCAVRYVLFDRSDSIGALESLRQAAIFGRLALPICAPMALLAFAAFRYRERGELRLLCVWLALAAAVAFGAARPFPHYIQLLLPPLCCLAGIGAQELWNARRRWVLALGAVLLLAQVAVSLRGSLAGSAGPSAENIEIAQAIRARTAPSDPILVWGPRPEIYVIAGRSAPGRFVGLMPIVGPNVDHAGRPGLPGALDELLADLSANPPALVVISPDLENYQLRQPHLRRLRTHVDSLYAPATKIGSARILRRREGQRGEPSASTSSNVLMNPSMSDRSIVNAGSIRSTFRPGLRARTYPRRTSSRCVQSE